MLAPFLLCGAGCSVFHEAAQVPVKTVAAVMPASASSKQVDPAAVQSELLRYADDFSGRLGVSLEDYSQKVTTPESRLDVLTWKVALNSSVMAIVTGADQNANIIDLMALSSLMRAFLERNADKAVPPDAFSVWLDNSRVLETNAWRLSETVLTPEQQQEFRAALNDWLAQNAGTGMGFFRRPQELAASIRVSVGQKPNQQGSLFSIVGLDPISGLDPAVREVTRSRLFAERTLFALQRMPFLLRWQTEMLTEQLVRQQQVTNMIANTERIGTAVEAVSRTAEQLPERISAERKAILEALNEQEGKLRELSAEVTRTLAAGQQMSTSLNTTITTFDGLMKRFGVGEPSATPPDTNSPAFNILDYGRAAEQIGTMAQQVDALLKNAAGTLDAPAVDKRIAQLGALSGQARTDAKSVLNHAFLLLAGLVLLIFTGVLVCRRLAPRRTAEPAARIPERRL